MTSRWDCFSQMGCRPRCDAIHSCIANHYNPKCLSWKASWLPLSPACFPHSSTSLAAVHTGPHTTLRLPGIRLGACPCHREHPPQITVDAELPWSPGTGCPTRNAAHSLLAPLLLRNMATKTYGVTADAPSACSSLQWILYRPWLQLFSTLAWRSVF